MGINKHINKWKRHFLKNILQVITALCVCAILCLASGKVYYNNFSHVDAWYLPQIFAETPFYLFQQAEAIHVNPLYILIPSTLCTSFAFLLPVANPSNAVVFSYGHLSVMDMVSKRKECHQVQ